MQLDVTKESQTVNKCSYTDNLRITSEMNIVRDSNYDRSSCGRLARERERVEQSISVFCFNQQIRW